jgi:putative cardiolipin synthase
LPLDSFGAVENVRIFLIIVLLGVAGCASSPRGAETPKRASFALERPEQTRLGRQFLTESEHHGGNSGYHIINAGIDGFVARILMARSAERTLDLQYFIFRGDETGQLLAQELKRAADRGVRVRILVDDGDTVAGDEQILDLGGHPNVEVRVFNPFDYRGHNAFLRHIDFMLHKGRLDYRMHNKLFVVDNSVALIGGRNVGNQYFQIDPESQFADDDVFAAGNIAQRLSKTFDEYWNSTLAVPTAQLRRIRSASKPRTNPSFKDSGIDYAARVASGEPYNGLVSGRTALTWAPATVVCDSPDKKSVEQGTKAGRLMAQEVIAAMKEVNTELLMITPYFVPSDGELDLLKTLRDRNAKVRVLSNSLESAPELAAQAGYAKDRIGLLKQGVELYEVRALLGKTRGSGQTRTVSRYGNYGLHAKLYVLDRQRLYIGSMNYDQRSLRINTEIGLIIDSPELAAQAANRFEAMIGPEEAYRLSLQAGGAAARPSLRWHTQIDRREVEFAKEPSRGWWQREKVRVLSLLPIDREL